MELACTFSFFIFIFVWFSRYDFMTFILLLSTINMIRNVRVYMIQNNINNSTNPFLNGIRYLFNGISCVSSKLFSGNSYLTDKIPLIKFLNDKYSELNKHFLELLSISRKQTIAQFSSGFNYTLTTVINPKQGIYLEKPNKDMKDLSSEFKKRNEMIINLNKQIMPTLADMIESINKLKQIKQNDSKLMEEDFVKVNREENNMYLYDSDDDNKKKNE